MTYMNVRGQWAYCMFFCWHYCYGWKESKSKEEEKWFGKAVRETEKNLVMILAFLSGFYLIGLNMAFCHSQNNFWWQCLIWYLAKPYDQDVSWQFFDISLRCLIAYSNIFVFHWGDNTNMEIEWKCSVSSGSRARIWDWKCCWNRGKHFFM